MADTALGQLVLTRVREFIREPEAVFWTLLFPILMTVGLGIAFRSRPEERARVAVLATAPGAEATARLLRADSTLEVQLLDDSLSAKALRTGKVGLVVVPAGSSSVEYRFDDTRPEGIAARRLANDALQRAAGRTDPIPIGERKLRERGSRYIDFVVPGLLGMGLMGNGIWGIGFALVDARRRRLLKRLVATPMSKAAYLGSFIISRLGLLVIEAGVLLVFASIAFGVPIRGSWWTLALTCVLSSLVFAGLGLLIAARPRTIEGASGLMNLAMVPMWVFSGVFFSATRFPEVIQPFVQALPLTAVNDALRASMLEGAAFSQLLPELAIIAVWIVATFLLALKIFRWQ